MYIHNVLFIFDTVGIIVGASVGGVVLLIVVVVVIVGCCLYTRKRYMYFKECVHTVHVFCMYV